MNTEEKAKAYDEVREKIALRFGSNVAEEIFSEFEMSKDERIRKTLIDYFNTCTGDYYGELKRDSIITWLEKQGEQKSVGKDYTFKSIPRLLDMIEPTDKVKSYCKKLIDSLQTEGYSIDAKIVSDCLKQMNGEKVAMATMDIEKQNEQPRYSIGDVLCDKSCTTLNKDTQPNFEIIDIRNGMYICDKGSFPISQQDEYELVAKKIDHKTTDKVVPKFQNGQWIVWQNKCYRVNDNGCGYELIDQNGLSTSLEYGTVDASARLWDITKDVRDGDVLYHKAENGIEYIVMSKGLNEHNNIDSYFRYNSIDGFGINIPSVLSARQDNITPATKEQRDQLEKAMADAGYEWNAETHELKKISQRIISAEAKEALYDKPAWSEEDMKEALRTEYEKGRADTLSEMKSSWSEEDERICQCLIQDQKEALEDVRNDKYGHSEIISDLEEMYRERIDWLESLKQRHTWKPSEEQMSTLNLVVSDYYHACTKESDKKAIVLKSILEQLKQL